MHPVDVLVRPVVTEKSTLLQEQGKYVFVVRPEANKGMVREAIQQAYGVRVLGVNMAVSRGKLKRYGPRRVKTAGYKKAIVTLKPGDKIQIFEGA
ncbi:MAG: 50S ribosomal protein L23 [Chloroflexi bacterium]|nr:50S ribosomal protein L23 [Chloroflexota bacterium]